MNRSDYARLRRSARLLRAADPEDLLQDALLVALQAGRFPLNAADHAWVRGVMRNLAAHQARTDVRRRKRDSEWSNEAALLADSTDDAGAPSGAAAATVKADVVAGLPKSARQVAVLALHGLTAAEIQWVLDIGDAAFRQRLTRIRRHIGTLPAELRGDAIAIARTRRANSTLDLGLIRRALIAELRRAPGVGSHDPDGHLLIFRAPGAHKTAADGNYTGTQPTETGDKS
jgi:DNA-directed RNA polymerase specialized sigma24 family protein